MIQKFCFYMHFCIKISNNFENYQYIWQNNLVLTFAPFFY
jgi:hypothetical protein